MGSDLNRIVETDEEVDDQWVRSQSVAGEFGTEDSGANRLDNTYEMRPVQRTSTGREIMGWIPDIPSSGV